jgi:hypothetical protein
MVDLSTGSDALMVLWIGLFMMAWGLAGVIAGWPK